MVKWSRAHSGVLRVRSWSDDELHVVLDTMSGDSHLLDDLSLRLLQLIGAQAQTTNALTDQVSDFFASGDRQDMEAYVGATLLHLHDTGLASRVDN